MADTFHGIDKAPATTTVSTTLAGTTVVTVTCGARTASQELASGDFADVRRAIAELCASLGAHSVLGK